MKRLLLALAFCACLLPASVQAEDLWRLEALDARIDVRTDRSIEVTETVVADFLAPRHGIFRYVPYRGVDDAGKAYATEVRLDSVTMDGAAEEVSTSKIGDDVVWKIGDPDVTMTGRHTYLLTYHVKEAVRLFEDFDELYWNVSGDGWDVPLPRVQAVVHLPGDVPADKLVTACYTGDYGSTAKDCTITTDRSAATFASVQEGAPMTIAVGFPKGIVMEPTQAERFLAHLLAFARSVGPWLIPLFVLLYCYRRWRKLGADPSLGTIVVQYEAPLGFRPAETRAIISQVASHKDLAPTIVDLASRGYLRIEEIEKKGLLLTSKDYELVRLKDERNETELRPYEVRLMSALFKTPASDRVAVSSLKNSFYTHIPEFMNGVIDGLMERQMFLSNPNRVRTVWVGVGAGFIVAGFILSFLIAPLIISGIIVILFGLRMPKWTPAGLEAARHARGFREFISKVEKYRAPWMEEQNIFFKVLPYALAFGLGAKWAKAFEGLKTAPPDWYRGAHMATWSPMAFSSAVDGWSKSFASTATSRPSSSSGSGGGGFSGGGGGGGGGGSW